MGWDSTLGCVEKVHGRDQRRVQLGEVALPWNRGTCCGAVARRIVGLPPVRGRDWVREYGLGVLVWDGTFNNEPSYASQITVFS